MEQTRQLTWCHEMGALAIIERELGEALQFAVLLGVMLEELEIPLALEVALTFLWVDCAQLVRSLNDFWLNSNVGPF